PDVILPTPRSCSKTASRHQKQPPARVASSVLILVSLRQAYRVHEISQEWREIHALPFELPVFRYRRLEGARCQTIAALTMPGDSLHERGVDLHGGRWVVCGVERALDQRQGAVRAV